MKSELSPPQANDAFEGKNKKAADTSVHVREILLELAYRLHATKVVRRPPQSGDTNPMIPRR
ncbi:hypothetical protein [Zavarzinella formosa]|uniref:hypothetical protein n=1 Tax=Zavarzinella formosa TaxID=360055 RepID=UPI00030F3034|nr:hypothetical protein [Zavarzinella formosa]